MRLQYILEEVITAVSTIVLVRHGQASFQSSNYDQLSPMGEIQAKALAIDWCRRGHRWDRVFVGTKCRQRETAEIVADYYESQRRPFPELEVLEGLDEHQCGEVVRRVATEQGVLPPASDGSAEQQNQFRRAYFKAYERISREWVNGAHEGPEESWQAFRRRVGQARSVIFAPGAPGRRIAAFTSGGPIAIVAGEALDVSDIRMMELSWTIRNIACCTLRTTHRRTADPVSGEGDTAAHKTSLFAFNELPHFEDPSWETLI